METEHATNGGVSKNMNGGGKNGVVSEVVLRVVALLLTLVAAILMGVDKQTKIVSVNVSPDLPPFQIPATAKFKYLSAFVFFVVANSIASVIAAVTLIGALGRKGRNNGGSIILTTLLVDLMMVALLFSSIGATGAVGLLGFNGNSHLMWKKVCNVYTKFCHQVMAASTLSLFGGIVYVFLVLLVASKLKRLS